LEFDLRERGDARCARQRYVPSYLSFVDGNGHVAWCVSMPPAGRKHELDAAAVKRHRDAPWDAPVNPWRLAGTRVLLVTEPALVFLDVDDGTVLDEVPFAQGSWRFPFFDSASVTFSVAGKACSTRTGPSTVILSCNGRVALFSPAGGALLVDGASGKLVEALYFTESDVRRRQGRPGSVASRRGKSFGLTVETELYLQ
jgi:hypothetical protein